MKLFVMVLLLLFVNTAIAFSAEQALFIDDFSGAKPDTNWSVNGGTISLFSNALMIRSDKSNPVVYLKNQKWNNCRITFELTRRSNATFSLFVGWAYPKFVKLTLIASDNPKLMIEAPNQKSVTIDCAGKIDLNVPTSFDVEIKDNKVICKLNNVEIGTYQAVGPISGSLAFGGNWGTNFEIRNLKVAPVSAE